MYTVIIDGISVQCDTAEDALALVRLLAEPRPKCPTCGSDEGQVVLPGSGDATCLHCNADWPVTP